MVLKQKYEERLISNFLCYNLIGDIMRFKNTYIEITNICNMNCSFCKKENRPKKYMSVEEFKLIISKIKKYTEQIYLHVKGEPLMHKDLEEILNVAYLNNIKVNITTNGTLLKDKLNIILKSKSIRQINISLHSNLNNDCYLNDILYCTDKLLEETDIYVNYRLWNMTSESKIIDAINSYYDVDVLKDNIIRDHLFIELEHVFDWPTLDNSYYNDVGKCYGLINQISILVNGDITPCCLDSESIIKLGNIFNDDLENVLSSDRCIKIIEGFRNNKKIEELCKHCNFLEKRNN